MSSQFKEDREKKNTKYKQVKGNMTKQAIRIARTNDMIILHYIDENKDIFCRNYTGMKDYYIVSKIR